MAGGGSSSASGGSTTSPTNTASSGATTGTPSGQVDSTGGQSLVPWVNGDPMNSAIAPPNPTGLPTAGSFSMPQDPSAQAAPMPNMAGRGNGFNFGNMGPQQMQFLQSMLAGSPAGGGWGGQPAGGTQPSGGLPPPGGGGSSGLTPSYGPQTGYGALQGLMNNFSQNPAGTPGAAMFQQITAANGTPGQASPAMTSFQDPGLQQMYQQQIIQQALAGRGLPNPAAMPQAQPASGLPQ